jgi:hypothetical protein
MTVLIISIKYVEVLSDPAELITIIREAQLVPMTK